MWENLQQKKHPHFAPPAIFNKQETPVPFLGLRVLFHQFRV
jgi:hypothetical protein